MLGSNDTDAPQGEGLGRALGPSVDHYWGVVPGEATALTGSRGCRSVRGIRRWHLCRAQAVGLNDGVGLLVGLFVDDSSVVISMKRV
jgi:hypothetical protein